MIFQQLMEDFEDSFKYLHTCEMHTARSQETRENLALNDSKLFQTQISRQNLIRLRPLLRRQTWSLVLRALKDWNLLPGLEMQVIVDGEEHHEVEEEGGGRQKVPDVMLVVKME